MSDRPAPEEQTAPQPRPDAPPPRPADIALTRASRPDVERLTLGEALVAGLSVLWLVGAGIYFMTRAAPEDGTAGAGMPFIVTLMALCLPVAMIWVAVMSMRASRIVRAESRRLQMAIDALRQSYLADRQASGTAFVSQPASVERKLDQIAQATAKTESTLATFASRRDRPVPRVPLPSAQAEAQPQLALGAEDAEVSSLSALDLVRAVNFPDNVEDRAGFDALRRGLKDRKASQLIQASQDVLTLLSQDGIYMDDLAPDRARPELWRRFAQGERGRTIAPLGGIRDPSSLALVAGRMRQDTIFRDSAHHFLRRFDTALAEFEPIATDEEMALMSETRTARAFMLLGRAAGTFD